MPEFQDSTIRTRQAHDASTIRVTRIDYVNGPGLAYEVDDNHGNRVRWGDIGPDAIREAGLIKDPGVVPIPMRLFCPACHEIHIDVAMVDKPHHTHACQHCGNVWRPALVPTVGVRFLPGFKNP